MQSLPAGGSMAAVHAGCERVAAALESYRDQITIAAFNGPQSTVISGDEAAVRQVLSDLACRGDQVQNARDLARLPFTPHGSDP